MFKKIALCVALLLVSDAFMNVAWYGHLRFKASPIWMTILASLGIAIFGSCFQIPANRIRSCALL